MCRLTIWLNNLVKTFIVSMMLSISFYSEAQENNVLSLQEVYRLSEQNYPAIKQKDLIKQTQDIGIKNLSTGYLPQLSINSQASYQSDVTRVDIPLPGIKIPSQSKDQYKVTADVSQLIYDGGLIKEQKNIQQLNASVEQRKVEIDLYNLKNRINQIYFNILYEDKLLHQTELLLKDLQIGINKVQKQVENGAVLRSNLQVLQVQLLQTQQRAIEIRDIRKGLINALSLFINKPVHELSTLEIPMAEVATDTSIARPELKLYEDQSRLFAGQQRLIDARNLPKASAFVQGGYGRPGLNLLSNKFDPFYITGIRLNWSLGNLYNSKREKNLLDINKQTAEIQKETFLLNTQSQLKQQQAEITKFAELVSTD
ncbi:MAG: TolC family protein, partial [Segetibacter sp.]|nr:TolC family protein [Segetibacter sp.]